MRFKKNMFRVRAKAIFESIRPKIAKPTENHPQMESKIDLGRAVARSFGVALGDPCGRSWKACG